MGRIVGKETGLRQYLNRHSGCEELVYNEGVLNGENGV